MSMPNAPAPLRRCGINQQSCPGLLSGAPAGFKVPCIGRLFLAAVCLESALMLAVSATLFCIHDDSQPLGELYAALGTFCSLALLYFSFSAVLSEAKFQFVACQIVDLLFTSFVVFQVFHNPTALGPAWALCRYEVMGAKLGFQVVVLALARPTWASMGFFEYKAVGANVEMKRMYQWYRAYLSLLKFDLFAALVLFFLVSTYLVTTASPDFWVGVASLAVSAVFFGLGWFAITHERGGWFWVLAALAALQPAFIAYKGVTLELHPSLVPASVTLPQFFILAGLAVGLRVGVCVAAWKCYRNFGRGLKAVVFEHNARLARRQAEEAEEASATVSLKRPLLMGETAPHGSGGAFPGPLPADSSSAHLPGRVSRGTTSRGALTAAATAAGSGADDAVSAGGGGGGGGDLLVEEVLTEEGLFRPASASSSAYAPFRGPSASTLLYAAPTTLSQKHMRLGAAAAAGAASAGSSTSSLLGAGVHRAASAGAGTASTLRDSAGAGLALHSSHPGSAGGDGGGDIAVGAAADAASSSGGGFAAAGGGYDVEEEEVVDVYA